MRALAAALLGSLVFAASASAALPRLHAVTGSQPGIFTDDGRQVLLRGVNVNQLGDYYQQRADLPATLPLREDDFAGISSLGMDVVRLIVHWSALEPKRGVFDEAYVARIRQAVDWAGSHGVYVVLDMHQDAWGKAIASPKDEVCAPGAAHQQGWDGAPAWATITDGQPTCRFQIRELAPAVAQAWTNFYADRDGIQSELVKTWRRLAAAFAGDPTVAGYDLLNEPNPGYGPAATDTTALGEFYGRAITAIRAGERSATGGFSHIAFFEPGVIWSAGAFDATPPAALLGDSNVVFAPHLYGGSLSPVPVDRGFDAAAASASAYGSTVWSGEWGWFGDPASDASSIREYAHEEDSHLWGGAWWDWKQACGDPHQFSDGDDTTPETISPSLNRFHCPDGAALGMPASTVKVLSRPYARMAPGRLTSLVSDVDAGTAVVRGVDASTAGSCSLELWVPGGRPGEPSYTGTGVSDVRVAPASGGWVVTACARGTYELRPGGPAPVVLPRARAPRACVSRRVLRLTVPRLRSRRVRSVVVDVSGRNARHYRGAPRHVVVSLRGLPRGRYVVTLTLHASGTRRYVQRRTLRTCAARRR